MTQSDRENIFWPRLRVAKIAFWTSTNPHQPNCIAMWRKSKWIATHIDLTQTLRNPACPSVLSDSVNSAFLCVSVTSQSVALRRHSVTFSQPTMSGTVMHCLAALDIGRYSVMLRKPTPVLRQYSVSWGCSFVNVGCYKYGCAIHGWLLIHLFSTAPCHQRNQKSVDPALTTSTR